ncbi:MAG TPA: SpoIIE family protein phosphatase [Bacteroidales bacterium]|nr:SpoIIE family protein phosphatase [Bacteroidales bacterium]
MKKIVLLLSLLVIIRTLSAQKGAPLLTNFSESREIENQNWAICQDIDRIMFFANRKGILSFDGQEWLPVQIPVIPFSMQANPGDGRIFVGGDNNFGFLEKDLKGVYKYISLSGDSSDLGIITKIVFDDSFVWFHGERSVNRYNLEKGSHELCLKTKNDYPFSGMFVVNGNVFVNVMEKGLFLLKKDTLSPMVNGSLTKDVDILFSLPYDSRNVLVGLSDGRLLLFDGKSFSSYQIRDDGYLRDNQLSEGIVIGDSIYAFSTLDGGALVVDKIKGNVLFTINNQNELPDDEIFALGCDNSGGLWLSHQYGLTRADLNLPVSNYSVYPGLKGNLTSSIQYNKELYVATSEGVSYLTEVKDYSEFEILVKQEKQKEEKPEIEPSETLQPGSKPERQSSRQNIFTKIFGRKITQQKTSELVKTENKPLKQIVKVPENQFERKIVRKLKSVNYVYKKVEGLDEKCRQLVPTKFGILAAANKGLFIIRNHKAVKLTENRYINSICWQPVDNKYYIAANDGFFAVKYSDDKWSVEVINERFINPVYSIIHTGKNTLWLGCDNEALRVETGKSSGSPEYSSYNIKNDFPLRYMLDVINDTVFIFTESEIYFFDRGNERFILYKPERKNMVPDLSYSYPLSNLRLVRRTGEWICPESVGNVTSKELSLLKLFGDVISVNVDNDHIWLINRENRVFGIDRKKSTTMSPEIDILIKDIFNGKGTRFNLSDIEFGRGDNVIVFNIVAPSYHKQNTTSYQYKIRKVMSDWSPWSTKTSFEKAIPKPGEYVLQIRAKDLWGNVGEARSIKFRIKPPFTHTIFFYILLGITVLGAVILVIRFREKQLHLKNRILEEKVKERTAEIVAQKQEITSSIEYASRIQMAMLPAYDLFKSFFPDNFIIYRPRNIVSGDFYWIGREDKRIFITVADCTGHGVPGAFMSTLGISTLNDIIKNHDNLQANTVLKILREKIKTSLHQTGREGEAKDGMDIAFCVLDRTRMTLQYSGAFNPLFIFQNGVLNEYKGDRMPIGIYYGEKDTFTNFEISVNSGDSFYLFSDGLIDQFGGPGGSKYK